MSNPFSPPPLNSGHFSDNTNPYQSPQQTPHYARRGMVNHVRVIVVLNAVQGILELIMGGFVTAMSVMFFAMKDKIIEEAPPGVDMEFQHKIMVGGFGTVGGFVLLVAILRIWAAIANYRFKGRILGIVSLLAGLGTAMTVYCAPTSIGIAVYGLVVLFNQEVAEAFEMRKTAKSADEVLQHFNARPY